MKGKMFTTDEHKSAEEYFNMGRKAYLNNNKQLSLECYKSSVLEDPSFAPVYHSLFIEEKSEQLSQRKALLEEILRLNPFTTRQKPTLN